MVGVALRPIGGDWMSVSRCMDRERLRARLRGLFFSEAGPLTCWVVGASSLPRWRCRSPPPWSALAQERRRSSRSAPSGRGCPPPTCCWTLHHQPTTFAEGSARNKALGTTPWSARGGSRSATRCSGECLTGLGWRATSSPGAGLLAARGARVARDPEVRAVVTRMEPNSTCPAWSRHCGPPALRGGRRGGADPRVEPRSGCHLRGQRRLAVAFVVTAWTPPASR